MTENHDPTNDEADLVLHRGSTVETRRRNETPGALRGEAWITLQTRQAQRLVTGRRRSDDKAEIIGLTRFGAMMRMVHWCAGLDDPYADWWLIKVEEAMDAANATLVQLHRQVEDCLQDVPGLEVVIAESLGPVRIPLRFSNPYAYRGAALVTAYDQLVRGVLTARHVGCLDRVAAERMLNLGGRAVRRVFNAAIGYKHQAVTRTDLMAGTARTDQAKALLGEVPEDILDGSRRPRFAPDLRTTDRNTLRNTGRPVFKQAAEPEPD